MLTEQQLKEAFEFGREQPGVEFKAAGPRSSRRLVLKVVRAMLGMTNRRDGGHVVVGVTDDGARIDPVGLSAADLATWTYDAVADLVSRYAEPPIEFDLRVVAVDGRSFVAVQVMEFPEVPVLCRRDFSDGDQEILREGACYIRPRRKPETIEVSTYADMRDLLDLAVEKGVRRFLSTVARSGVHVAVDDTSRALFDAQMEDFI